MIADLNRPQLAIVEAPTDESMLVLAGPGSGKTTVLVRRILFLLAQGVDPKRICVVTFTNQAAREMERRLAMGLDQLPKLGYIGTIHGLCLMLLRDHGDIRSWKRGIAVLDDEQSSAILRETADWIGYQKLAMSKIIEARDEYGSLAEAQPNRTPALIAVAHYYRKLRAQQAIDFRGLLSEGLEILKARTSWPSPLFTHLLVDEYQDCTDEDVAIFQSLGAETHFMVGDPDQAIYSFRGGDIFHIIAAAQKQGRSVRKLELNYRSAPPICAQAQSLIKHNKERVDKATLPVVNAFTEATVSRRILSNDAAEAATIANEISEAIDKGKPAEEIAVLARTNAIADKLRKMFHAFGIRTEANVAMKEMEGWNLGRAILGLLAAPLSDLAVMQFLRLLEGKDYVAKIQREASLAKTTVARIFHRGEPDPKLFSGDLADLPAALANYGCDPDVLAQLCEFAKDQLPQTGADLNDLIMALRQQRARERRGDGVAVLTMHAAKGREWDTVYIAGLEDEVIPGHSAKDIEEERRLLFVAITRAERHLILSQAHARQTAFPPFASVPHSPSRFLVELD